MLVYKNIESIRRLTNASLTSLIDVTNLNFKSLADANLEFLNNISYDEVTNSISLYSGTFELAEITNQLTISQNNIPTFTIASSGNAIGKALLVEVAETQRQRFTDFPTYPELGVPGEIVYTGVAGLDPVFGEDFIGYLQDRGWVSLTSDGTGGGGIGGTNYIYVMADGTDIENAAELQAAYNEAISRSPSAENRMTVIAGPGYYNFESTNFIMDTQYIDLVSLDGNKSIIFNSLDVDGTIFITANDVFVKGINVQDKQFNAGSGLDLLKIENCQGGDGSFSEATANGTFTDCIGGDQSFGSNGSASGTFTNCQGGDFSFGGDSGSADGTFTDCIGGDYSFGGDKGSANGTFTDCQGGDYSFGGDNGGSANGTFTDCQGGDFSFGGSGGSANGIFTDCQGGEYSFGGDSGGIADGTFTDCRGGDFSFGGGGGSADGTFTNCQGGNRSFGSNGNANGIFTDCIGGNRSFGGNSGVAGGTFTNCQGGDGSFGGNGGNANGIFTDCIGEDQSFGGAGGLLNGKLYYCRLTSGTFITVVGAGVTRYCLDGNSVANNQG